MNTKSFNNVKLYFKVDYQYREIIKKFKARWDPNCKQWYIIHNHEDKNAIGCFGDFVNIIKYHFTIDYIKHNYYKNGSKEHWEIEEIYNKLVLKIIRDLN